MTTRPRPTETGNLLWDLASYYLLPLSLVGIILIPAALAQVPADLLASFLLGFLAMGIVLAAAKGIYLGIRRGLLDNRAKIAEIDRLRKRV